MKPGKYKLFAFSWDNKKKGTQTREESIDFAVIPGHVTILSKVFNVKIKWKEGKVGKKSKSKQKFISDPEFQKEVIKFLNLEENFQSWKQVHLD